MLNSHDQSQDTNLHQKKRVGITGQSGFMGTHLFNYLTRKENVILIPFMNNYFEDSKKLESFVKQCDVIVHFAALNRHNEPKVIYDTNIKLVKQLITALESTNSNPYVLFSSSIQEERDNVYGNSKREGRELFQRWAGKNKTRFTALIIPNVFGPFGKPFYNSVISTFSYQIVNKLEPKIEIDASLKLIYINDLLSIIYNLIVSEISPKVYNIPYYKEIKVTEILKLLNNFKEVYLNNYSIPQFNDKFELDLFNTFRSYIDLEKFYPVFLKKNEDNRGFLTELIKENCGGQIFYSKTKRGITRGNHFHTRKIERFCVISGQAEIKLRKIGNDHIISFIVDGEKPTFIDMPIWYTHNITNIGNDDLVTLFWCNEIFNPDDLDTYSEEV